MPKKITVHAAYVKLVDCFVGLWGRLHWAEEDHPYYSGVRRSGFHLHFHFGDVAEVGGLRLCQVLHQRLVLVGLLHCGCKYICVRLADINNVDSIAHCHLFSALFLDLRSVVFWYMHQRNLSNMLMARVAAGLFFCLFFLPCCGDSYIMYSLLTTS